MDRPIVSSTRETFEPIFLGRADLLATLWGLALKGRHTLITGAKGIGKSALMERLYRGLKEGGEVRVLLVEESRNLRPMMLALAEQLHEHRLFRHPYLADTATSRMTWRTLLPKARGLAAADLARAVITSLQGQRCLLLLDHLDRLVPTTEGWFHQLINVATLIVATSDPQAKSLKSFLERIPARVEVPALTREETYQLIDACLTLVPIAAQDPEHYRRSIYHASGGNPKAVKDILADHSLEKRIDRQGIRELDLGTQARYVATSWAFLLLFVVFGALRYAARGIGDRDNFIIGAVMMLIMIVVGAFARKANRP